MKRNIQTIQRKFFKLYPDCKDISVFSAPGRTEICGNHTDHQHGCVLAAAVDLETVAVVSFTQDSVVRLHSEGFMECEVDLSDTHARSDERGKTQALIRGVAHEFEKRGIAVQGFDAYVTSNVPAGGGLSSSAAFEVLLGTIFNYQFNDGRLDAVEIARIGQAAENNYFGKQSGLMDQMASSFGGLVFIDFKDCENPLVEKQNCDFNEKGFDLFVTNTRGSHADLIDDYVSIPAEMSLVARQFGKMHLREVDPVEFYERLPLLRKECSDRALLRASHFFSESDRARLAAKALGEGDIDTFLKMVRASGLSSIKLLQNIYSPAKPGEQALSLAIMVSERTLCGKGAVRVHGGGFAGTIQAYVPKELSERYRQSMDELFGEGSCIFLKIRKDGGIRIA